MKRNKIFRIATAVITAVLMLSSMTAFAFSAESEATATTETVIEDNRTLTQIGRASCRERV